MANKRPNRHSNPSKGAVKPNKGRFIFFRKKNRQVKDILRATA